VWWDEANFWDGGPGLLGINKPFLFMRSNFCGDCELTGSNDGIYNMHFFLKDIAVGGEDAELCHEKAQHCRSGNYPQMEE